MKKTILSIIIILFMGYFFKDQTFFIDFYDKYLVVDYFTLSIYIAELIAFIFIIHLIIKKIRSNNIK